MPAPRKPDTMSIFDVQTLGKLHVDYCFNCGSCTFVCPAKRPCTQMMGLAKAFYLGEIKKGGNK